MFKSFSLSLSQVTTHLAKFAGLLGEVGPGVRAVGEVERVERYQLFLDLVEGWR